MIKDLVTDILKDLRLKNNKPRFRISPSRMTCKRLMYLDLVGAERIIASSNFGSQAMMAQGTAIHEVIQDILLKATDDKECTIISVKDFLKVFPEIGENLFILKEDKFETLVKDKETDICFKVDSLLKYHDRYKLLEIKTMYSIPVKPLTKFDVIKKYGEQIEFYLKKFNLQEAVILIYNTVTREFSEFDISITDLSTNILDTVAIFKSLSRQYGIEGVRQVVYTPTYNCKNCDYCELCKKYK